MSNLLDEVKYDADFIKGHRLQPKWFKVLKVLLVPGLVVGYGLLFGVVKTVILFVVFVVLSAAVHLVYRAKTEKFTTSWLDFEVTEQDGEMVPTRIGKYYYLAVAINAAVALVISQVLG